MKVFDSVSELESYCYNKDDNVITNELVNPVLAKSADTKILAGYVARAPGRVNIIGEHIDYCGFAVLPMAIQQDVTIVGTVCDEQAVPGSSSLTIELENLYLEKYPPKKFKFVDFLSAEQVEFNASEFHWSNYFLCGVRGALDKFASLAKESNLVEWPLKLPAGKELRLQLLVKGTVPQGAGLSSSSAIVCASCLAMFSAISFLAFGDVSKFTQLITPEEIAQACCASERYVGTEGGG
jgi:galactokinase